MVKLFKNIEGSYIISLSTGQGQIRIEEFEYNRILQVIKTCPNKKDKGYHLKTDLTWEEYDLPSEPELSDDSEISDEKALNILLGGTS